jgi:hypothetical protein
VWQDVDVDFSSVDFWASAFFAEAGAIVPNTAVSEPTKITCAKRMWGSPVQSGFLFGFLFGFRLGITTFLKRIVVIFGRNAPPGVACLTFAKDHGQPVFGRNIPLCGFASRQPVKDLNGARHAMDGKQSTPAFAHAREEPESNF